MNYYELSSIELNRLKKKKLKIDYITSENLSY